MIKSLIRFFMIIKSLLQKGKWLSVLYIVCSLAVIGLCAFLFISFNRTQVSLPIDYEIYFNETQNDPAVSNISFSH